MDDRSLVGGAGPVVQDMAASTADCSWLLSAACDIANRCNGLMMTLVVVGAYKNELVAKKKHAMYRAGGYRSRDVRVSSTTVKWL